MSIIRTKQIATEYLTFIVLLRCLALFPCSAGMWYVHRGQASALACELIENKSFGLDFHIAGPFVPK